MNDDIQRLRKLVDTYKLSRPVSPELQQYVIDSRTPDLRNILRRSGKYGLVSWFVIMIYMLFKKYGFHITMMQSKIIAGITAAAVASGSGAVIYRGAKYIIDASVRPPAKIDETIDRAEPGIENHTENILPDAPIEQKKAQEKQTIPVNKEMEDPGNEKPTESGKMEKVKKKKEPEHNVISDVPSL